MNKKVSIEENNNICFTITLEEYKDLLITKGRYEELKSQILTSYRPNITYTGTPWFPREEDKKVICRK